MDATWCRPRRRRPGHAGAPWGGDGGLPPGAKLAPVGARLSRTDERNRRELVQKRQIPADVQNKRRIGDLPQPVGVGGVMQREYTDVLLLTKSKDLLGTLQIA